MELIREIVMPDFPRQVKLSDSRRAKYFKNTDKLAMKYLQKERYFGGNLGGYGFSNKGNLHLLAEPFEWVDHKLSNGKKETRLYNSQTREYVIKNPQTAGTPNWEVINGQKMYNNLYHPHVRNKIMEVIHNYMISFLQGLKPIEDYPITITGFMFDKGRTCDISKGKMWDVGNRQFPYNKAFEDVAQKVGLIKQDDFEHIIAPTALVFKNLDNDSLPKQYWRSETQNCRTLVYQIYKL